MLGSMCYETAEKMLYASNHCETHIPECFGHSVNASHEALQPDFPPKDVEAMRKAMRIDRESL